jgi:zinc protease
MALKPTDNVSKKELPNGLTVLFKEDRSNPVVAINLWFGVGSVNETEEQGGLAHFQEHMVFKGTERHGVGEIAKLIKSAGGNLNAGTSYSYTMYYVVMPSEAFSLGLDIQADAMMNSTFDAEEFKKERLVVIDEARMYDDTPDSFMFYRTMELGYDVHNYRRPIAGRETVVEKFTRDQLLHFYKRYYRPANAVLVVVGDVAPDTAFAEIDKVYGGWSNGHVDILDSPTEPPQTCLRYMPLRGTIDHAYMGVGFHVPSILDEDYPALEMLSTLLSAGKSSRLYRQVVEEKHAATTVNSSLLAEKWPGYFMVFASTPGDKWEDACDAVFEELTRFRCEPAGRDELMKARRQVEKSMYGELETVEGQASNLGYYQLLGDYKLANCSIVSYLPEGPALREPTKDDLEGLIAKKLSRTPGSAGGRARSDTAGQKASIARKPATAAGKLEMKKLMLDNGVTVLVKTRTTVPMVSMLTILRGGARLEPAGKSGLSMLTNRTLIKGTRSYNSEEIVNTIEGLGGSIQTLSTFDVTGAYTNILSEYLEDALPVFKEVLREPEFAGQTVDKEKARLLKELAKRHDHPVYLSIDELFARTFGDHPYAYPFIGDEAQLAALTDGDCRQWYHRGLTPKNMVMVFVGDIDESRAMEIANELVGDLPTGEIPEPDREAPDVPARPGLYELRRKNLRQAVGLVGFIAPPMLTPDAIALGVLNAIMTGLGGRLFHELRDQRSLGYMAGSSLASLKERSMFYGYSNPAPDGIDEAIGVILDELDRVAREPVTDDELTLAKGWLTGTQTMKLQRNISQAIEYGIHEALFFGFDVVDRAAEIIQKVTKDDILKAAAGVFHRDKAVMIRLVPEETAEE